MLKRQPEIVDMIIKKCYPHTFRTLLAQDSVLKDPIVFVFAGENVAERISNVTGAHSMSIAQPTLNEMQHLVNTLPNRKLAAIGFNQGGQFALQLAAHMIPQRPLNGKIYSFSRLFG